MKQIILFPKDSLSSKDKERLTKEGYFYLEVEDPTRVVTTIPAVSPISGDDILMSAMKAISEASGISNVRDKFFNELYNRMKQP